ncbi:MAG: YbhB/YbcL family Raf kinase inhibitor-like protein [Candidatus Hydrothermarchaeaceae archaeon]
MFLHKELTGFFMLIILLGVLAGCIKEGVETKEKESMEVIQMEVSSSAFEHNQPIPGKYTCEGEDVSPPLAISGVPGEAKSLALVVDDPDAPMGVFDHWIAWNLEPDTRELSEGVHVETQGKNDFGELRYRGPCPPPGPMHHYRFKVYALDAMLDLPRGATKGQLEEAMEGHILAKGELVGTYKR